jgi:hypothetical protein
MRTQILRFAQNDNDGTIFNDSTIFNDVTMSNDVRMTTE